MKIKFIALTLVLIIVSWSSSCNLKSNKGKTYNRINSIQRTVYSLDQLGLPQGTELARIFPGRLGNKWISAWGHGLVKLDAQGNVQLFTTSNSALPSNYIRALAQDGNNNIWVGTSNGLLKISDTGWTVYTPDNSSLPFRKVSEIAVDQTNRLWIAGLDSYQQGIATLDGDWWSIYKPGESPFTESFVYDIDVGDDNTVWMALDNDGLLRIKDEEWTYFNHDNTPIIPWYGTNSIVCTGQGEIWATCYNSLASSFDQATVLKYNGSEWLEFKPSRSENISYSNMSNLTSDPYGNIWMELHYDNEIAMFNGIKWTVIRAIDPSFPQSAIYDMNFDESGVLWLCMYSEDSSDVSGIVEVKLDWK